MAKNILNESYSSGIVFIIKVVERGHATDNLVTHNPDDLRSFVNKYTGA